MWVVSITQVLCVSGVGIKIAACPFVQSILYGQVTVVEVETVVVLLTMDVALVECEPEVGVDGIACS